MGAKLPTYVENCFARIYRLGSVQTSGWRTVTLPGFFGGTLLITGTVYRTDMSLADDTEVAQALSKGIEKALLFNGDFCGVFVTVTKAVVFSDRMCARKVYCTVSDGALCVGTRMDLVAQKTNRMELSQTAAGLLLFEKALVTQNSWYDAIKPLCIGTCANFSFLTHKLTFDCYDPVFGKGRRDGRSQQELGAAIAEDVEATVMGLLKTFGPEGLMITLSAGLDARMISAVLHKNGVCIPAFVLETDHGFDEIAMARRVNEYYGFPLQTIPQPKGYFMQHIDECISAMEYTMCEHVWFAQAIPWLAQQKRVCYTGLIVGNTMRDHTNTGNFEVFGKAKNFKDGFDDYFKRNLVGYDFLQPEFRASLEDAYKNVMEREMLPYLQGAESLQDWHLQSRASRQVLRLLDLVRPYADLVQPFSCNQVLDILLAVPADKLNGGLYSEVYRCIDPASETLVSSKNPEERKASGFIPIQREKPELIDFLAAPLREGLLAQEGLLDVDALNAYAEKLKEQKRPKANQLMSLYTYEMRKRETERLKKI